MCGMESTETYSSGEQPLLQKDSRYTLESCVACLSAAGKATTKAYQAVIVIRSGSILGSQHPS